MGATSSKPPFKMENIHLVAAIDFGTTYSGYAFSFKKTFEDGNIQDIEFFDWRAEGIFSNFKAPTTALFDQNMKFHSFGYDAEKKYAQLIQEKKKFNKWFYFKRFKMKLIEQMKHKREFILEDENGKGMPAKRVFTESIKYLKKHLLNQLDQRNPEFGEDAIFWVLTVPSIWNDSSKQFMRESANEAGIPNSHLVLALEAESAALHCKTLPEGSLFGSKDTELLKCFKSGGEYMILDLGGGTLDTTVHRVDSDGSLVEIHKACGGPWGGIKVDEAFLKYITQKLGPDCIPRLKLECADAWIRMEVEFEMVKRDIHKTDADTKFTIPQKLLNASEISPTDLTKYKTNLIISHSDMAEFFKPVVDKIIGHVHEIVRTVPDLKVVFMVGSFSESPYIKEALEKAFKNLRLIVPLSAGKAILRGAVLFGYNELFHNIYPNNLLQKAPLLQSCRVTARICRATYGIEIYQPFDEEKHRLDLKNMIDGEVVCTKIFSKLVKEGDSIQVNKEKIFDYTSSHKDDSRRHIDVEIRVFVADNSDTEYIDADGCKNVGKIVLKPPKAGWPKLVKYKLYMYFGTAEFRLKVVDETNKQMEQHSFDFLD